VTLAKESEADLRRALTDYYTHYYRDQLGLPDWNARVTLRLDEEHNYAEPMIRKIEDWLEYSFSGKRVLVVGAGTGAESIALSSRGAEVYGIEPNNDALSILKAKARVHKLKRENFLPGLAEDIPFPKEYFDFVYCYAVLEHVQHVEKSIDEMIRVCKTGGLVFIQTPDYRFPYEGHYKLALIPFAPPWVQKIYLSLRGRPTRFLGSLNFVTTPKLDRYLWRKDITAIRVFEPDLLIWKRRSFFKWFCETFAIQKHQYIFLRKGSVHESTPAPDETS